MPTFDQSGPSDRNREPRLVPIAVESVLFVLATMLVVARVLPLDFGARVHPHPLWAVALIVAVRYGLRGVAVALPAVLAPLALATPWLWARWPPAEVTALALVVLASWIAEAHQAERRLLARERHELRTRLGQQDQLVAELAESAVALRGRVDRVQVSLTFLRAVAERLEGGDALAAAQAALELATARIESQGGVVRVWRDGRLEPLASLGDCDSSDSDLLAPIYDADGTALAVIALHGVAPSARTTWAARELALIADWCREPLRAATRVPHAVAREMD
jgi:hypothetical protein